MNHRSDQVSPWVQRFLSLIPPGEVLDLACGYGRHTRLLAAAGHAVLAVDLDPEALAGLQGENIVTQQVDLENGSAWPYAAARFAGIIITNYLHRPLFPGILASLRAGGVLLVETFALGNGQFGKPSNPDFLLVPGELAELARSVVPAMHVVAYEDGYVDLPKPALIQRICMVKPPFTPETRCFQLHSR